MAITAKICGVNAPDAVAAVIGGGASHMGLNFYPPSPRYVSPALAAALAAHTPGEVCKVGVFVDADDDTLGAVNEITPAGIVAAAKLVKTGKRYALGQVTSRDTPAFGARTFRLYAVSHGGIFNGTGEPLD